MKAADEGEPSLAGVSRLLWRHRLLVALASLICALIAGVLAFTSKPIFRAEVVVTQVRERAMGGISSLATNLGGLASLAGLNLTPGTLIEGQEAAAVLESHHLADEFIRRNGLLPQLLPDLKERATLWKAVRQFKEGVLAIRKDQHKGVITVSIEWTDPTTAARWANDYVALANELIRNRAVTDSTRNIAYLNGEIAKTNAVELRKVMYNLIENETKTLMVANGRAEYAFEVVDPAVAPELKVRPHRLFMILIGFILGFAAAGIFAFSLEGLRRYRRSSSSGV